MTEFLLYAFHVDGEEYESRLRCNIPPPQSDAERSTSVPPSGEQRAIAAFLDRETAKIDALVAKKERLIELLQEKRTALITRAVTKGLDPNVPMKDSGVEWLGDIPAHWDVCRLRGSGTESRGVGVVPATPLAAMSPGRTGWTARFPMVRVTSPTCAG